MNHLDHVSLLRPAVTANTRWADFGSGTGSFTLALAELIGPSGEIFSVDRDQGALREQKRKLDSRFPGVMVAYCHNDYTQPMSLPALDGLVIANALHFQKDKNAVVRRLRGYLRPGGRFVLVEYDTDNGNRWVPYPLSYETWRHCADACGLQQTSLIGTVPSRFLGKFYAAVSREPGANL